MMPFLRISSHAAVALLAACAVFPAAAGQFFIDNRPVEISELSKNDVRQFLAEDWAKFDKYVKDARHFMTGKMERIEWDLQLTPPFPTTWPPQQHRSVTYYAYAEYQEATMHGIVASRSAPWAKVQLNEGMPATKTMLATAIGPVVHGEGGFLGISIESAARIKQIDTDGAALLPDFVSWQAIPDNKDQVQAIREYYCQWALRNLTAKLIKDNHRAFFDWLSCPARTIAPGLLYPLK
ncbi:hypothetical protein Q4S45_20955 [Massilia sp. R2A-15]|uniref:hypothetical protein n=1 Tax=Massilia sp. R2A-15 TaxID=3064278 RepID=UPI0027350AF9|nr:hypothetical protein [Massilia sp. R2A-15]WLI89135.1 hypothetical protein Q4S45_20955 [Massilia sp. R2A-15]